MLGKPLGVVDAPIRLGDDDALGLRRYASALAKFIVECDTPMTVGIQGDWGAGKTSLMNLIELDLSQRAITPLTFTLNTWQYAQLVQGDALALVVLRALHEKVAGKDQGLARVWGRMASAFDRLKAVQLGVVALETKDEAGPAPDLAELKSAFAKAVAHRLAQHGAEHDRLVVFIDDLDRILPERAVEILESLKNFVDVPGCVFVLACDYEVVRKGLKKRFDVTEDDLSGRSFFDKIIQVPFRMPVYTYEVDAYVKRMLDAIQWKIWKGDDGIAIYKKLLEHSVGFNPRGLKRLCNTLLLLRMVAETQEETAHLIADEHRLALLFGLVCMESSHPALYQFIASRPRDEVRTLVLQALRAEEDSSKSDDEGPELADEEMAFLRALVSIVDKNQDEEISLDEIDELRSMLKLSAITSVGDEANPGLQNPSANDLLDRALAAGKLGLVSPLHSMAVSLVDRRVLRERTTSGSIAYEARRTDGRWAPALYITPQRRKGEASVSLFTPTMENLNDAATWGRVRSALIDECKGEQKGKGNMLRVTLVDEARSARVLELIRQLAPFSQAAS